MPSRSTILDKSQNFSTERQSGAAVVADEHAIEISAQRFDGQSQVAALYTILHDFARLRVKIPVLPLLSDLERYIDVLRRKLTRARDGSA